MGNTSRKLRCFGFVFLMGGLWIGVRVAAAAPDAGELSPTTASTSVAPAGGEELQALRVFSPPGRFWLRADYLMWSTSGMHLPALVTTSPQGTLPADAGVLPGAAILYGDRTVLNDIRSGYRTMLGTWLDAAQTWDVEFDYLSLGERSTGFSQSSTGDPILARPYYDVQAGAQASQLVAYPGVVTGSISVEAKDHFESAGVLLGHELISSVSNQNPTAGAFGLPSLYGNRTDLLAGFRYYNLGDRLSIVDNRRITQAGPLQDTTLLIHDNFRANNNFYGGEIGFRTHVYRGRWSMELLTKLALGSTHRTVTIDGQTVITTPNQPVQTYQAGLLALGSNSNTYQRDDFTVVPQLGLDLGYQVTRNLRAYLGYNVLCWGRVARSGDQIDLNVDPRNIPPVQPGGTTMPTFTGQTSCFWAQGINLGAELRF